MTNQTADIIACNGKIATQNEQRSIVEAVAIRDGKFLAVGTDREVMAWRGEQTQLINLNKRTAIPAKFEIVVEPAANQVSMRVVQAWNGSPFV